MISLVPFLIVAPKATDITFVRHGETVANATGKYNSKTLNVFSEKGKRDAAEVSLRLQKLPTFDLILVSPSERALRTIAPYLKATRRKATVWPLLYECCTGKKASKPAKDPLKFGSKITIPKDISSLFVIQAGHDRYPVAPDYAKGLVQVDASIREFKTRFTGQRVLLVGHSGHGGQFIKGLTGKWKRIENGEIINFTLPFFRITKNKL